MILLKIAFNVRVMLLSSKHQPHQKHHFVIHPIHQYHSVAASLYDRISLLAKKPEVWACSRLRFYTFQLAASQVQHHNARLNDVVNFTQETP